MTIGTKIKLNISPLCSFTVFSTAAFEEFCLGVSFNTVFIFKDFLLEGSTDLMSLLDIFAPSFFVDLVVTDWLSD